MSGFSAAFGRIFRDNGLEDFLECSEKFEFLYGKLIEANSRVNITAITDRDEVIVKHFADCVRVAESPSPPPVRRNSDMMKNCAKSLMSAFLGRSQGSTVFPNCVFRLSKSGALLLP